MRRRINRGKIDRLRLDPSALRPAPADDLTASYWQRLETYNTWLEERSEWIERRARYAEANGWPGGELAMFEEENEHHPIPDGPFDIDAEIAAGMF